MNVTKSILFTVQSHMEPEMFSAGAERKYWSTMTFLILLGCRVLLTFHIKFVDFPSRQTVGPPGLLSLFVAQLLADFQVIQHIKERFLEFMITNFLGFFRV